jgi:hypothetical protein
MLTGIASTRQHSGIGVTDWRLSMPLDLESPVHGPALPKVRNDSGPVRCSAAVCGHLDAQSSGLGMVAPNKSSSRPADDMTPCREQRQNLADVLAPRDGVFVALVCLVSGTSISLLMTTAMDAGGAIAAATTGRQAIGRVRDNDRALGVIVTREYVLPATFDDHHA